MSVAKQPQQCRDQGNEEYHAFPTTKAVLDEHSKEEDRPDTEREFASARQRVDTDHCNQRSNTQNQRHVRDIRAQDIADTKIGVALHRCNSGHEHLGQARTEADDQCAHHYRRDVEHIGDRHCALDKMVRSKGQDDDAHNKENEGKNHNARLSSQVCDRRVEQRLTQAR